MVHTLNMVHLKVVPDDRRERSWEKKRERFLVATQRVLEREGLGGITMAAVADEADCAVGTIYTYFPSKGALLTALQGEAVASLRASFTTALASWDPQLEEDDLPAALDALVRLVGFGAFWAAAAVVLADEFELQRQLLSARVTLLTAEEVRSVLPVAQQLFDQPAGLLEHATASGAIGDGDQRERVLRWLASMNGVLLLEGLAPADRHLFRAGHLARRLTADLLVGWGASAELVEVADTHVDRLAAAGPMAPPPDGPGYP